MNYESKRDFATEKPGVLKESFTTDGQRIFRRVHDTDGNELSRSAVGLNCSLEGKTQLELSGLFYQHWLRLKNPIESNPQRGAMRIVDLFAGCGGLSLGIDEAAKACGFRPQHQFFSEIDSKIADVFSENFSTLNGHVGDISELIDGVIGERPTSAENHFISHVGSVDLLCGGPPCQGYSDLNNYTRRDDPRNSLYFLMARAAELLKPKALLIENVPGVLKDRTGSYQSTISNLIALGYKIETITLNASSFGVPQSRKRTFLFAARSVEQATNWRRSIEELKSSNLRNPLWAISDISEYTESQGFRAPSKLSAESKMRVDWLFENDEHELPDRLRPDCHRLKSHSYNSVYGRMYAEGLAPTITTGFLVMGQGRFIHPTKRRTLTPHEGARLQTFPDYFKFGTQIRSKYAKMIGNAVPPLFAYYVGLATIHAAID
ncbi:DNA (cytosine-5)-methyltransferase 1 [Yoonia rosea]|uniref:Cytosine-specific methyltransferase n=1 Tax=Yoonia rosea TaxID=287098 RepID=A0A1R3WVQ7_9RHOB|nr:DNA cytosine methyltransferase [Yoonia rosea]SIT82463.1 DNA (cytosine-5)-methyltransferase 1 [Yoonia rosea]